MGYIMTVDPGLREWAWALFDEDTGSCKISQTITYKPKLSQEERLYDIYTTLSNVARESNDVSLIVAEKQFVEIMSQIVGCIRTAAGSIQAKTKIYMPKQWKLKATGKGNISEEDLKQFVVERYPEFINRSEHEVDCAGIYIAYKNEAGNDQAVKKAPKKR